MIAVDTSAIVAIALTELEEDIFTRLIVREGAVVATPVLVEASLVLARKMPTFADDYLGIFMSGQSITVIDFSFEMYREAYRAFRRFGSGRKGLNFGDCLSYGAAKVLDVPLLYKGDDFSRTDIRPALAP